MVGAIGTDAFGSELKNSLACTGVDVKKVIEKEGISTGTATIIVDHTGDNRIIVVPGANGGLSRDEIDKAEDLIAGASIVILQFEIPLDTIEHFAHFAEKNSVPVILNPAPVCSVSDTFLSKIKYLIVYESEAESLSGCSVVDVVTGYRAAHALRAKGIETVIVTLGKQGALAVGENGSFHVPAREVNVIDTTAAGDTFVGAFAAACVDGRGLKESVELAVNSGTLAITCFGAQPSIPTKGEVRAFMSETIIYQ